MNIKDSSHHSKTSLNMLDKLSNKISAIKDDITGAVKERSRSISSDRHSSMSSTSSAFSFHDESISIPIKIKQSFKISGDTGSTSSLASSSRHALDSLTVHRNCGGIKPSFFSSSNLSTATSAHSISLINSTTNHSPLHSTPSHSQQKLESIQDVSTPMEDSNVKECFITKIDPVEMTAKPTTVLVSQDAMKRSAILLAGPKFRLNCTETFQNKSIINSNIIYSVSAIVGVICLIITLWKPISPYFAGLIVGSLFAIVIVYIWIQLFINDKIEETAIEEWIDFPALDSMLTKVDKEDKNTNIQVTGAYMSFHSYDADRDDDFVRYPCDIRLDGYRLIIQLASKPWSDDKKPDKEIKFIGCREYLVKEARMILVPEATLTRSKYWMNDYPIVIQNLQILDKQIFNKQQLEKSKAHINDFFTNNATIISIWFETGPQKEEWFHKLALILLKGKEEIERVNNLRVNSKSQLSSTISNSSLYRRQPQTDSDIELISNFVTESHIRASVIETQINAEKLQQKAKKKQLENIEKDASGTRRTIARKSKKFIPNETSLQKVLQTPECLDEAAITINFMTRRLLCDMFDISVFKDLLKEKVEMKLKELAVSILENLRVVSIDLGNTFPIILKIEPMQWNTQGIWFNLFLYYRGSFKLSVRTRVALQKLINYDPETDKPIFAQHHSAQMVHKDDERIDENDLIQRQKLLAKEPEIPEMAVTRKLGTALTNLALNKYFQFFANLPFIKTLFEKFSQQEVGVDVEVTSFSGVLTLNIPPPPSDRIWVGFPEMPDLNIKVVPTYGANQYSYTLLQDLLSAKIRAELKRLVVLPAMDDQLLPFFRDWAIDVIGEIVSKPVNPNTDNYKTKLNVQTSIREGLQEYKNTPDMNKSKTTLSNPSETNSIEI
ncbi:unnamed protein product [Adineta steineri]|uniref:SMP-LTD domain-containing protein n=1 Tax=Adineta steineri TaxID=433720 RepID=A0A818PTM5_9BILA|nr:unnamed protein product [Adineta steineri]CAF3626160.1 unnamed protein product [Adineta steineri]